jgi:hypothetical protein
MERQMAAAEIPPAIDNDEHDELASQYSLINF